MLWYVRTSAVLPINLRRRLSSNDLTPFCHSKEPINIPCNMGSIGIYSGCIHSIMYVGKSVYVGGTINFFKFNIKQHSHHCPELLTHAEELLLLKYKSTKVHNLQRNGAILTLAHETHQTDVHRFDSTDLTSCMTGMANMPAELKLAS